MEASPPQPIRIVGRPVRRIATWTGFPAAAMALAWLWTLVAEAAPRGPLQVIGAMVAQVPQPARSIGIASIAALAGIAVAALAQWGDRAVYADEDGVTERTAFGRWDRIAAVQVAAVFIDGPDLVITDVTGRQWSRLRHGGDADRLREVFSGLGYPWRPWDPHAARFHRWEPGTVEVPPVIDRLLRRRADAVRDWTDARMQSLTEELSACGVVVRDDGRQQYWRLSGDIRGAP